MTEQRLPDFIRANMETILHEWEAFARDIPPARQMNSEELRDHAKGMLNDIADDLDQPETPQERSAKSKGRGPASKKATQFRTRAR